MHQANQKIVQALQTYQKEKEKILGNFQANMKKIRSKGLQEVEAIMTKGEKAQMKKMEKELEN